MNRADTIEPAITARVVPGAEREATARARMEALYERELSDEEWARIAQTVQAFAAIVTRWNQQEQPRPKGLAVPVAIPAEQG
ncbi:MAG TPA: hypothetical protein VMQ61_16405 [Thermoanaerobaculia bacterium]|nr:hypothetical protein [Thermoanaerobaculia bacterium]